MKVPAWLSASLIPAGLGLAAALFVWGITLTDGLFLKDLLNGYEYRSYDARFKARTAGFEEASIDTVVIIDIDQQSVDDLGNYFRWYHWRHAELLDYLKTGGAQAIIFDVLFDPEPELANDTAFVRATRTAGNTYHAIALSEADTLNFRYPMDAPPAGWHFHITGAGDTFESIAQLYFGSAEATEYVKEINADRLAGDAPLAPGEIVLIPAVLDVAGLVLPIDEQLAERLPAGERFDIAFINLLNAAKGVGSANFPQDQDGIIRRAPTAVYFSSAGQVYPSLTMAAVMDILDIPPEGLDYDFDAGHLRLRSITGEVIRDIPIDDQGRMWVNYYGTYRTFRYISYSWATPEMLPPDYFRGKIVLIGSTLAGLMDLRNTPVQETFPGVEIHANTIMGILDGEFVKPVSTIRQVLVLMIISILLGGILVRLKMINSLMFTAVTAALWIVFAYGRFIADLYVWEVIRPVLTIGVTFLAVNLYQFLVLDKDKRFLEKTFSTYISPELIEQMVESNVEPHLGGSSDILTAYFTDIQSFSSFSEILTATKLVELLNEYLTAMTDVLLDEGGTLDKYEGDAIVAFYGAPVPQADHATRAISTAIRMQEELAILRRKWKSEGDKWPDLVWEMRMRIGINTGEFVTGNMGSQMRMNYTMMGDIVNTAARLEASAKVYGIYIQVTTAAFRAAGEDNFEWRDIDKVKVMGKSEAVETVEIMSRKGELPPDLVKLRDIFQEGIALYRQQKWDAARKKFEESEKFEEVFPKRPTTPSKEYMKRCDFFKADPPGEDWDGSWTLTSK